MISRPTGSVTFLFTDIEGSTQLAQEFPDTFQKAVNRHHFILQNTLESNSGFIFEIVGDAFCCAFENANDAVNAAVEINLSLTREKWEDAKIKIRTGIHSGKVEWTGEKYLGYITLARTARVMSAAYGEQILISNDTYNLLDLPKAQILFRDLGERQLKDLMQPIRLFQVTTTGLRYDFPPLKTLDSRKNNLPVQITSFIGREEEIKTAKEILKQTNLLTLTGPGGSGKTRLALKIGADAIDEYESGVWIVEFESLSENSNLANSITKVLGIIEQPKVTVEEQLLDYIKDKEILLIFDNCEHVVNAAAMLAYNLLTKCPKLKIIATSREALRCEGEMIYQVSSLKYPEPNGKITPEKLNQYESARLFIERASSVNLKFSVNDENADALARICYQLEGIPLAIELAAARAKTLSVEQIDERLDDRFNFLKSGYRTAMPRQQTLRALISWSYELLTEKEKTLWKRLSVFTGGWTLEAAENICTDEKIIKSEIVEILVALAEKSIIIFNAEKIRYRMLESIKQFGAEKLQDEDELESLSVKHFKYFTELTITADEKLKGDEIVYWLNILDNENPNIVKALEWSIKSYNTGEAAKLTLAMAFYWQIRGLTTEGLERIESILKMISDNKNTMYYKVITAAGIFYWLKSDFKEAETLFEQSLNFYRENSDKAGTAESLKNLGHTVYDQGEYLRASEYFDESMIISNELGDKREIANILNYLGNLSFYRGDYSKAKEFQQKSLDIRQELGDKPGIAVSLNGLGLVALNQGNYSNASGLFEKSLSIYLEIGFQKGIAVTLNNLGVIAYEQGDYLKASEYYDESLVIRREIGNKHGIALLLNNLGSISYELGNYNKALEFYEESSTISRDIGDKSILVLSLNNLGEVVKQLGEPLKAAEHFKEGLTIGREIGEKPAISNSLYGLGTISLAEGDYLKAVEYITGSLDIRSETGDKRGMATSLNTLAKINFATDDYSKAKEFYEQSLKIGRELGDKSDITTSLTGLSAVLLEEGKLPQALNFLHESIAISRNAGNKKETSFSLYYMGWVSLRNEKFEDARKYFNESLILRRELGNVNYCVFSILSLAVLRVILKDFELALKLLSFVKNFVESNKLVLYKNEQTSLDKSISELKEKLSEEDFSEYLENGKSLTQEEAMELAINYEPENKSVS